MSDLVTQAMLSVAERSQLSELEATVENGMKTFVDVGKALAGIRDARLYRQSHETFESYCRDRWGMSKPFAHRQIQAAEIARMVPVGTERQARELAPLKDDPKTMREAWKEANSNGTPTAERVREAVRSRTPKAASPRMEPCPTCGRPMRADKPARGAR